MSSVYSLRQLASPRAYCPPDRRTQLAIGHTQEQHEVAADFLLDATRLKNIIKNIGNKSKHETNKANKTTTNNNNNNNNSNSNRNRNRNKNKNKNKSNDNNVNIKSVLLTILGEPSLEPECHHDASSAAAYQNRRFGSKPAADDNKKNKDISICEPKHHKVAVHSRRVRSRPAHADASWLHRLHQNIGSEEKNQSGSKILANTNCEISRSSPLGLSIRAELTKGRSTSGLHRQLKDYLGMD